MLCNFLRESIFMQLESDAGCTHHSVHGSQYVSLLKRRTMHDVGIRPSMGAISSP